MNDENPKTRVLFLSPDERAALRAATDTRASYSLGELPTLVVAGPDRNAWLNGLLTCDVQQVAPGTAAWGLLLELRGKIQATLVVVGDAERLYLGVMWGERDVVLKELDARLVMEDAEVTAFEHAARWELQLGPLAAVHPAAQASGILNLGGPASVSLFLGDVPSEELASLGDAAWAALRVQRVLPWGGIDFGHGERPHEAALDRRAISWSKGCYLGQEVVCMQDMRGKVKRSVRAFFVPGDEPPCDPCDGAIELDGQVVGRVTTAVFDPHAGGTVVLARVPLSPLGERPEAGAVPTAFHWACAPGEKRSLSLLSQPGAPVVKPGD